MRQCGAGGGDERVDLAAGASRGSVWSRDGSCGAARARSEAMSVSEGRRSVRLAAAARQCERGRGVRCGARGERIGVCFLFLYTGSWFCSFGNFGSPVSGFGSSGFGCFVIFVSVFFVFVFLVLTF